ncbi:MAG: hypothetical protein ABFD69_02160 [Candidatus Sumerlaeia bacterium]
MRIILLVICLGCVLPNCAAGAPTSRTLEQARADAVWVRMQEWRQEGKRIKAGKEFLNLDARVRKYLTTKGKDTWFRWWQVQEPNRNIADSKRKIAILNDPVLRAGWLPIWHRSIVMSDHFFEDDNSLTKTADHVRREAESSARDATGKLAKMGTRQFPAYFYEYAKLEAEADSRINFARDFEQRDADASNVPDTIEADGEIRRQGGISLNKQCKMVRVRLLDFDNNRVWFSFVDGRLDGAAVFHLTLFDKDGRVVAEAEAVEPQNRKLPAENLGGVTRGGDDKPNRLGIWEFKPKKVAEGEAVKFRLTVRPASK